MGWEWADKGCEETFWVEEYSKSQYTFGLYIYVCVCVCVCMMAFEKKSYTQLRFMYFICM